MGTFCSASLREQLAHMRLTSARGLLRSKGGMAAEISAPWLTFSIKDRPRRRHRDSGHEPGLWKQVTRARTALREFDLPLEIAVKREAWDDETGDEIDTVGELCAWAQITAQGRVADGWQSPPADELLAGVPAAKRTLQVDRFVRQAQLVCEPGRLRIQLPLVAAVPSGLSEARRGWFENLRVDAQQAYRMVRLVPAADAPTAGVNAEVDLSGAPRFAMPDLIRIGLDAARHVVSRLIWTSELLVDPAVTSTVWEVAPESGQRP